MSKHFGDEPPAEPGAEKGLSLLTACEVSTVGSCPA